MSNYFKLLSGYTLDILSSASSSFSTLGLVNTGITSLITAVTSECSNSSAALTNQGSLQTSVNSLITMVSSEVWSLDTLRSITNSMNVSIGIGNIFANSIYASVKNTASFATVLGTTAATTHFTMIASGSGKGLYGYCLTEINSSASSFLNQIRHGLDENAPIMFSEYLGKGGSGSVFNPKAINVPDGVRISIYGGTVSITLFTT